MKKNIQLSTDYATDGGGVESIRKDFSIRLPVKEYTLRCTEAEFGKSKEKEDGKGNNPMITRTFEIISPEIVKVKDGESFREVIIQGLQLKNWLVITAKTKSFVEKDCAIFGVDLPDDERPNLNVYIGKEVKALLRTTVKSVVDEETGEPIMSGGKPKVNYQHSIAEFLLP